MERTRRAYPRTLMEASSGRESLNDQTALGRALNGLDVDPFVDVLLDGQFDVAADINEDGVVNGLDVDQFVTAILGGTQPVPEPTTISLTALALLGLLCWRRKGR